MVGFLFNVAPSKPASSGRTLSCASCGLYKDALSPKIKPYGEFGRSLMNIGEGPGETEDKRSKPWQGKVGRRLKRELRDSLGVDLFEDCVNVNSVNCRPPKNRAPTDHEIACCREVMVHPAIREHQPHTIILYGGSAIHSVIGSRWRKDLGPVAKWRGWRIPDQELNAWICPTFHPSYIERESDRDEVLTVWKQDLQAALETLDLPFPSYPDPSGTIVLLHDEEDILSVLKRIARGEEGDLCAIDYETTGLKPQADGHRIVCASIATARDAYAFMGPRSQAVKNAWCRILRSRKIRKVAHNMKFEDTWSKVILGVDTNNWAWDSMLAAHVLDNRPGISGLKFQIYINYGIVGYDAAIEPFLYAVDPKDGNSMNRIDEAIKKLGEDEVLTYCGLDSLFCRRLAVSQSWHMGIEGFEDA